MTLVIGARCKNGCIIIADRRNHIWENDIARDEDNFRKYVVIGDSIIYNHGYNRIGNRDWKLRAAELTADATNPIYSTILTEMAEKVDKMAAYVFVTRTKFREILITVKEGITMPDHGAHDRIVSGSGRKYVELLLLNDLASKNCDTVRSDLEMTFGDACRRMRCQGGAEFSKISDVCALTA